MTYLSLGHSELIIILDIVDAAVENVDDAITIWQIHLPVQLKNPVSY